MKVFVTGCGSGLGKSIARCLLEQSHDVWGVGRREGMVDDLQDQHADRLHFSPCDVREDSDCVRIQEEMSRANFMPDIVIANAGIYRTELSPSFNFSDYRDVIETNLLGAMRWTAAFLPAFEARGSGQFIAISSLVSYRPDYLSASYPGSKAALSLGFRSLQLQHRKSALRFKTIHFGPLDTLVLPRYESAANHAWITRTAKAARFVTKVIDARGTVFYYPPVLGFIFRLFGLFPDAVYDGLMRRTRR